MEQWEERSAERSRQIEEQHLQSDGEVNTDDIIVNAIADAADRAERASLQRDQLLAVAVEAGVAVSHLVGVTELHHQTVLKRAQAPENLAVVIRYKEKELESLRRRQEQATNGSR